MDNDNQPLDPATPPGVPRDFGAIAALFKKFVGSTLLLLLTFLVLVVAIFLVAFFNF